jgi:predicted RNA-binding Zn ribbon-like protein
MEKRDHDADRAPASLAVIQDVINTRYGRTRPDDWKAQEQLQAWLLQRHLLGEGVRLTQGDYRRVIEVRETLRALLRANSGRSLAPDQAETFNYIARHAPLRVHLRPDGQTTLLPDIDGIDGVIGSLLSTVFIAMTDGTWPRLKVCANDRCQKVFYDHSKNHSGIWCSMAVCGSRNKARAYRRRHQEKDSNEPM